MSKNIFSKIKDIIYDNIKGLVKTDKKTTYLKSFQTLLEDHKISENTKIQLEQNFCNSIQHINDNATIEHISNIMWLTIMTHVEKNTLHINELNEINATNIILFGNPGCGKTTFLVKYINYNNIQNIQYDSDLKDNFNLIQRWSNVKIDNNNSLLKIYETNSENRLIEKQQMDYKTKIISVIDINADYEIIKNQFDNLTIDYIVLSKIDQMKYMTLILEIPTLTKAKIIYLTEEEIASKKNKLKNTSYIINILAQKILNKKINNQQEIEQLINSQINIIDFNSYRMYLQFINQLDNDKIINLTQVYNKISKYIQLDEMQEYSKYLSQIQNPETQRKILEHSQKQIYIIDSMNKKERNNYLIISEKRRKSIIKGSGTDAHIYEQTIQSYQKYKNTINKLKNNNKEYKNIFRDL